MVERGSVQAIDMMLDMLLGRMSVVSRWWSGGMRTRGRADKGLHELGKPVFPAPNHSGIDTLP